MYWLILTDLQLQTASEVKAKTAHHEGTHGVEDKAPRSSYSVPDGTD
jgi:hypothetical protein